MYDLQYLPSAERDFSDIVRYIALELVNPKAADDFANLYDEKLQKLRDGIQLGQPLRGNLPKRIKNYGYRWILVKNYLVFFTVDKTANMILVHHVTYGKRNLPKIL